MSIRIHELAKKISMDNKQLLALLKERKYDVKSVSSTIDNISAEAIEQEFGGQAKSVATAIEPEPAPPQPVPQPAFIPEPTVSRPPMSEVPQGFTTRLPAGMMVKSAQDIAREKEELAKAAKPAPVVMMPTRSMAPPAPPRPSGATNPPMNVNRPLPISPPPASNYSSPRPSPTPISAPRSVTAPPFTAPRPSAPPSVAPPSTTTTAPFSPSAPPTPPPIASIPGSPKPAPVVSAPIALPATPGGMTTPPIVTIQGDLKTIHLKPPIVVRDFATALGLKPFKLISELMEMGIFASMNQNIEESVAVKVGEKHGFILEIKHRADAATQQAAKDKEKEKKKPEEDEAKNLVPRPPVVCILGHVDHGKTSLLDVIRKANVASGEAGGITQHIGAYQIEFNNRKITFLDTPGHAAFNKMRARGAGVTDIAVLVVAADDGFMPQTDEALKHAQNAKVALIVAVNKMDVKGANLEQVKSQMQQRNIAPEDWGGETITVPVSAIKGEGINELLEMILLQADVLELKANPKVEANGVVIESQVDVGRGPLATVIVQRGTLRVGDAIVCGSNWAKVRAMFDDKGETIKEALPASPVRVIGWTGTPDSGATFRVVKNAREAEKIAEEDEQRIKKQLTTTAAVPKEVSVESLFANIAATQQKVLKVIVKADVFGSTEAIRNILEGIKSTKVSLEIVSTDVGLVTKNDVLMANAAGAVIIGFNTKLENGVTPLAKHHGVRIESFDIIYELGDKVREILADLLEPDQREVKLGGAEVRATFPLAKGFVAGCLVTEGKISRNASARLRRGKESIYTGKIATLKRFKDDANEVRAGLECGIKLDDFNGYQVGDTVECFEIQKFRAAL